MRRRVICAAFLCVAGVVTLADSLHDDLGVAQFLRCERVKVAPGRSGNGKIALREDRSLIYDNTTAFSGYMTSVPGQGALLGEDYEVAPGPRSVDGLEFEVTYAGDATTLDRYDVDFYFYDGNTGGYIGGVTFADLDVQITPYYSAFYSARSLGWNIVAPDHVIVLQWVYNMVTTGGTPASKYQWGRLLMNSFGEIGYSANDFYKDTTVGAPPGTEKGWYWFGDLTYLKANFYFGMIHVPEPISLAVVALGALTLLRRR